MACSLESSLAHCCQQWNAQFCIRWNYVQLQNWNSCLENCLAMRNARKMSPVPMLWRSRKQSLFYPYLELIQFPLILFLHQVFAFISSFADGVCDRKNGRLDIDIVLSPLWSNLVQSFGLLFCLLPLHHPIALCLPLLNMVLLLIGVPPARDARGSLGGSGTLRAIVLVLVLCWQPWAAACAALALPAAGVGTLTEKTRQFFPSALLSSLLSGQMFTWDLPGHIYLCEVGHPQADTSHCSLNLSVRWDMLWRNKQQPVSRCLNQPFTKSDQFLFQITFTRCNSNCFTYMAVISIVPAIA